MQTSGRGRKGGRQTVKWEERVQFKRPIQNTIRRNLLARGQWRVPTRLHLNTQRRSRLENPNPNKRKTLFGRVLLIGWIRPETTGLKNEIDVNVHRKKKKKRKKVDWSWLGGSSLHLRHGVFPTARQWPSLSLCYSFLIDWDAASLQGRRRRRRKRRIKGEEEEEDEEEERGAGEWDRAHQQWMYSILPHGAAPVFFSPRFHFNTHHYKNRFLWKDRLSLSLL